MKIAITGATGFVGRELSRVAQFHGIETIPIVRRAHGIRNELVAGDLETANLTELTNGLAGVDAVVHLAARTHVMGHDTDSKTKYFRTNVEGTVAITTAAIQAAVGKFVFLSSVKVNGEETADGESYSGSDLPQPEDEYGITKLQAEGIISEKARSGHFQAVTLRPPMIYGADVGGNFARLVAAVRRRVPLPFGLIDNRRSMISVRNLCEAVLRSVLISNPAPIVLTVSDGPDVSTRRLVQSIGDAIGRPARLLPVPSALIRAVGSMTGHSQEVRRLLGNLQVDTQIARDALGWQPSEQLDSALQRMFTDAQHAQRYCQKS